MAASYASTDTMNQRRPIQANIEHYDDRAVFALVAQHLFNRPAPMQGYSVDEILNTMAKRPMPLQLAFTQAYRAQLGVLNQSNVLEVHKLLFGISARRVGIAALKALNVLDEQWCVRS